MKYRILSFVLAIALVAGLFPVSARAQEHIEEQPVTVTMVTTDRYDTAVEAFEKLNQSLEYWELPLMQLNATLTEVAMIRAAEVGLFCDYNGTRPDGSSVYRMEQLVSGNWTDIIELPSDDFSASATIHWINHEVVGPKLMSGEYTQVGIGFSEDMCVLLLGKSDTDIATVDTTERVTRYQKVSILPSRLNPSGGGFSTVNLYPGETQSIRVYSKNEDLRVSTHLVAHLTEVRNRQGELIATMKMSEDRLGWIDVSHVGVGSSMVTMYLDEAQTVSVQIAVNCYNSVGEIPGPEMDPNAFDTGSWGDNITWTLEGTKMTLSGEGEIVVEEYGVTNYPWQYYREVVQELVFEEGITTIPERGFSYFSEVVDISLPSTLTAVGNEAFGACVKLQSLDLPDSVTSVGARAFASCSALETIRLSENLTVLPSYLLSGTSITSIHIPESVTALGEGVFMCCVNLESVILPDGITEIWDRCFEQCTGLQSVTLPKGLTVLNSSTFSGCVSLSSIELPESLETIGNYCFNDTALESIVIPENVEFIGDYAFWCCYQLARVELPDTVDWLHIEAFAECPSVTIGCHYLSKTHIFALENEVPVEFLPEDPATALYPIVVYQNEGGTVNLSSTYSPVGRYVLIQILPDAGHLFASMYVLRSDGLEEELDMIQIGEQEYLVEMPPCAMFLEITFLVSEIPFTDVRMEDYYYAPVLWAVSHGITAGTSATTFSPDASCTRAQVVTFLWRAFGEPEPAITENPFVDVKPGDYYYKAVLWALESGITAGTSAANFSPDKGCTRAQVVTFLWRACGKPEYDPNYMGFADVSEDMYYHDAVRWAAEYQITSGVNSTHFAPDNICSRAQIVTFLFRTFF